VELLSFDDPTRMIRSADRIKVASPIRIRDVWQVQ